MRIANNMEKAGRPHTSNVGNMVDESSSDALLSELRLDEQGVQLRTTVGSRHHSRKAGGDAVPFLRRRRSRPQSARSAARSRPDSARNASRSPALLSDARH
jgi:hypothetical protein